MRISSRSIVLRALLCALVLLLALAPISGAAAATPGEADAVATESPAAADEVTTTAAADAAEQADAGSGDDVQAPAETETETDAQLQETSTATADVTTQQADQDGPYTPDPDAEEQPSGNGNNTNGNRPCAGCVGNADDKNPPGQMPGPDDDGDSGYECDGNSGASKGNPAHTQCPPPTISLTKTAAPVAPCPAVGQQVVYTFTITNTGRRTLHNVALTDPMLGGAITLSKTTLTPGEVVTAAATYALTAADVAAGSVTNTATVTGASAAGKTVSDTAQALTEWDCPSGILITKQHTLTPFVDDQTVERGATATWVLQVTNTGQSTLTNVTVTDPLAPDCNRSLGTLAAGQSAPAYDCSLGNVLQGFTNTANVAGTNPDGTQVTASDTALVGLQTGTPPLISLVKTASTVPACPEVGQLVTYTFRITNGPQSLSNVTLDDPMLGGPIALSKTTLAAGEVLTATATYALTAADLAAGAVTNTATVTGQTAAGQSATNTASASVLLECPDIELIKDGPRNAEVGEQITYTFTVTNTGSETLTNVRISDERLKISNLPVSPSTLAPNQVGTATATYTVTKADGTDRQILNIAMVRARTPDGTEITSTDDHTTLIPPPGPQPRIRLEKSGPKRAVEGERITYTFTVTNNGETTLLNVNITDELLGLEGLKVRPSTLEIGDSGTATVTYVITAADAEAGSVYNTAVAKGTAPDGRMVRDRDDHTVEVPGIDICIPGSPDCPNPCETGDPDCLPATGLGTTGFALTALLSLALGGVLLGIAGSGNLQAAMASGTVNGDGPLLALLRQWNLAPKPGGAQARRRRRR